MIVNEDSIVIIEDCFNVEEDLVVFGEEFMTIGSTALMF